MRRALVVSVIPFLAAGCGGGGNDQPPFQCPAPQAPAGNLSGTLGGASFTPAEMGGLLVGPVTCPVTVGGVQRSVQLSAVILGFSSFAGLCSPLQQYGFCWNKANATLASVQIVNGGLIYAPAQPGPGTYSITVGVPTVDLSGNFQVAGASYGRSGAACATLGSSSASGGTVTFDTVTSTQVTGSVALTFTDASTLAGTFTAAVVPLSVDLCKLVNANSCTAPACLP